MTDKAAEEIAALLNARNQLARKYEAQDVLDEKDVYEYEQRDGKVVVCIERRIVQWYQLEVRHLCVDEALERKGLGSLVYARAEEFGRSKRACVVQCTIREGNHASENFFDTQGFVKVSRFLYAATGNNVGIWQKVLTAARDSTMQK
jgi:ribosomal protein S18 acetylase RimI-like enzyme